MDFKILDAETRAHTRGQYLGFSIAVVTIVAGVVTAAMGHPISGAVLGGTGVIGLAGVFVFGRRFPGDPKQK